MRVRSRLLLLTIVAIVVGAAALASAQPAPADAAATLDDVRAVAAPCPPDADHCFGLVVHVAAAEAGGLVQAPPWIAAQIANANRLFTPLGVGFTIAEVRALGADQAVINSRADRDRLGRKRFTRGVVHVFVVAQLANVDEPGELNGVHWRHGKGRWVILAARARDLTLAHELGHFFGLPHSEDPASIMNKTPRAEPPPAERGFPPDELARMRSKLRQMLRDRSLRDHPAVTPGR